MALYFATLLTWKDLEKLLDLKLCKGSKSLWTIGLVMIYIALGFLGVTTSSLGIPSLQSKPEGVVSGLLLGEPRQIRSDEWAHTSAFTVGSITRGNIEFQSPLAINQNITYQTLQPTEKLIDRILLFEGYIAQKIQILSPSQRFAFLWWLPILIFFFGFWSISKIFGISSKITLFCSIFIFLAPLTQWVSYVPLKAMGYANLGLALLFRENQKNKNLSKLFFSILSGFFLARSLLEYTPFILMYLPVVFFCLYLREENKRKWRDTYFITCVLNSGVLIFLFFLSHLDEYQVLRNTEYPGQRRTFAEALPFGQIFGAPFSPFLSLSPVTPGSNLSELTSYYNVFFIFAAIILLKHYQIISSSDRKTLITLFLSHGVLLAWSLLNFGIWTSNIPLLNLIPPSRAFQFSGIFSILFLTIYISRYKTQKSLNVTISILALSVTILAGLSLKSTFLPTMSYWIILFLSILFALYSYNFMLIQENARSRYFILFISALVGLSVNPVMVGLSDLDGNEARIIRQITMSNYSEKNYWITNQNDTDTLLLYNGIPNVSGQQFAGPNRELWRRIDSKSSAWNIGIAAIFFKFEEIEKPKVARLQNDIVEVTINPCQLEQFGLEVAYLISDDKINQGCVTQIDKFIWWGKTRYIYFLN